MPDHSFRHGLLKFIVPALTLILGWHLGRQYQIRAPYTVPVPALAGSGVVIQDPQSQADLSLLWRTWKLLNDSYVEPEKLTEEALVRGAVEGLVRAVGDPYTVYLDPEVNQKFQESMLGELDGIGAELTQEEGIVRIVAPIRGSPAEAAGLLPEDVIAEVDGEEITGLALDEVITKIRGKAGTQVKLQIYREGEALPIEKTITRAHVTVPSTEAKTVDHAGKKVGVVTISQFGEHTLDEVKQELAKLKQQNVSGFIIDLRFNGGGYLDGAVELVSLFQKEGKVVSVARRGAEDEALTVTGDAPYADVPLVVLINAGSASASEIAAGALQDHKRATIVGEKSFGKGTVQDVIPYADGSSLKVTVAHWLTPNGKNLSKEGVTPDVVVERTAEDFKAEKDPQMEKALEEAVKGR